MISSEYLLAQWDLFEQFLYQTILISYRVAVVGMFGWRLHDKGGMHTGGYPSDNFLIFIPSLMIHYHPFGDT